MAAMQEAAALGDPTLDQEMANNEMQKRIR